MTRPDYFFIAVIVVFVGLSIENAVVHSALVDEIPHIASGVSNWKLGRFSVY